MVKAGEIAKIPFIDNVPIDRRMLYNTIVYSEDAHKFTLYPPDEHGKMISIDAEPIEAAYWSKTIENPSMAIGLPFFQLMTNNFSFPEIMKCLIAL